MTQFIYQKMWDSFKLASKNNEYELDTYLTNPQMDNRRGITALTYLNQSNEKTLSKIIDFQHAVKMLEPEQYYHPLNELHLTILSIISCLADFQLSDINAALYIDIFQSVFRKIKPIKVHYHGISASRNCIIIQGFPADNELEKTRNKLRNALKKASIMINVDARYKLVTAHCSAIRFRSAIKNSQTLFDFCNSYRNYPFGEMVFTDFELVFNNFYQNLFVTKSLSRCSL